MKIIAHRGASGEFPENSLLAFEMAIVEGADGIELDVHFHQPSQQFIVLHDLYLDKTTDKKGHFNHYDLASLQSASLGQNQHLVTLEQALKHIDGRILVNIEVKTATANHQQIIQQVTELNRLLARAISDYHCTIDTFIISAFNHHFISLCKQLMPQFKTAAIISHCPLAFASFTQKLHCDFINLDLDCICQELIEDAHQLGLKVWIYTVDRAEDIAHCHHLGADGIFTNYPRRSASQLSSYE